MTPDELNQQFKTLIPRECFVALCGGAKSIVALTEDTDGCLWVNLGNHMPTHGTAATIIRDELIKHGVECHLIDEKDFLTTAFCINRETFFRAIKQNQSQCNIIGKYLLRAVKDEFKLMETRPVKYTHDRIELKVPLNQMNIAWDKLHQMLGLEKENKEKLCICETSPVFVIFSVDATEFLPKIGIDPDKSFPPR